MVHRLAHHHFCPAERHWILRVLPFLLRPGRSNGLLVLLFVLFWLAVAFAGPYWGWFGWWW
ncbi:MAG: hypothetical protein WA709_06510 [Stellaceae bacterium]